MEEYEEEIFYEARESISTHNTKNFKNIPNSSNELNIGDPSKLIIQHTQDNNQINLNHNFSLDVERRETVYEDAEDENSREFVIPRTHENISDALIADNNLDMEKLSILEKTRKTELLKEKMRNINLDIEFLKKNLKIIPCKSKGIKDKHLKMVFELQSFQADSQQIWVAKFSYDGKFLATGGKSGVVKIWEVFSDEDSYDNYQYKGLLSYLSFLNENAYRIYTEHTQDIIDLCWSPNQYNILISASLDHNVILWDVNSETSISKFLHSGMVTAVSFSTNSDENEFASGCFDKIVRIWNPNKLKVVDYINVQEYITSITYFPSGEQLAIGSHTGRCSIYDLVPKLKYAYSFDCKNKSGKYSDGRKITNIEFLNKNNVLITTNDSSVRLVNVNEGKTIQKYKGHLNDEYMIRANFEEIYDLVISASDDGFVYIWKKINPFDHSDIKNKYYEFFKSFAEKENSTCSLFASDITLSTYMKKLIKITQNFFIKSIIINTSNTGKLQILINTEI